MPLRDLAPGAGIPGPRRARRRHPESDWDPRNWPNSRIDPRLTRRKTNLQKRFLLKNTDMVDLWYEPELYAHTHRGIFPAKRYWVVPCERRAWEIYGGPGGLQAEKAVRAEIRARREARVAARGLPPPPPPGPRPRGRPVNRRVLGVGRGRSRAQIPAANQVERNHSPEVVNPAPARLPIPMLAPVIQVRVETPELQLDNAAESDSDSDVVILDPVPTPPRTPPATPRRKKANRALSVDEGGSEASTSQQTVAPSTPKARKGFLDLTSSGKKARAQSLVRPPVVDNILMSTRLSNPSTPSHKRNAPTHGTPSGSGSQSKSFLKMADSQFDSDSESEVTLALTPSFSATLVTPRSSQRMKTIAKLALDDNNDKGDMTLSGRSPRNISMVYPSVDTSASPTPT
ncbi:hypothetical protein CPB83DRAFT_841784 [Crepidotus variabilis]|uniref:Uncharacterized protein n=1 Tax=Crepidotus variabilis TaxID=179855 RepID=A0A9P6JWC2_9AGAR|nr:hypothetical protein CPB83DRAFT_841784 [Crepidotus variabilis]